MIALALLAGGCGREGPRNLLLVTLDTTRADFLGAYGRTSARTPNLDQLARDGALFENCYTAIPITTPSHSTILTGLYPLGHGVRDNGRFTLPAARRTLAEILGDAGRTTGAAIGGYPLTREWGLDQGFTFYDDQVRPLPDAPKRSRAGNLFFDERPCSRVNDALLPWLRAHAREPFFAWAHYWDPHQPHSPPPPFDALYPQDPYQGEIAYADQCLGVLLAELVRQGVDDETVVAVVADHGEGRGEHSEDTHSMLVYNATLHVPLILRGPGVRAGARVAERVGTVDLLPTLTELLEVATPPDLHGRSLVPVIAAAGDPAARSDRRPYYAESLSPRLSYGWGEQRALFQGAFKYIYGPRLELYDLASDPREVENLAAGRPADAERMQGLLESFVAAHASPDAAAATAEVSAEARARLAALGYLSGNSGKVKVDETLRRDGAPPQLGVVNVSLWSQCKQDLDRGDFLSAKSRAELLVEREPNNGFFRSLLAVANLGLGLPARAAAAASEGPIGPENDGTYLEVVRALINSGDDTAGRRLLERIVALHPSGEALYFQAELAALDGDRATYEAKLRDALARDDSHTAARRSLAVLLAETGREKEAEPELVRLVAQNPLDPAARLNLGSLLAKTGRFDAARTELERALALDPRYCKARYARVAIEVEAGDAEAARGALAELEQTCGEATVIATGRELLAATDAPPAPLP